MKTQVTAVNTVEYDFEIEASDADLSDRVDAGLKEYRPKVQMKGFRPGRVPMSLVRKMYGRAIAFEAAEKYIQEAFEAEVLKKDDYDVLGSPVITKLEYDLGQDLNAVIRFGVRPDISLQSLEGESVTRFVLPVTDEDIEGQIEYARSEKSVVKDAGDAEITEDHITVIDMQLLDADGENPVGDKATETIVMKDTRIRSELLDGLKGKKPGDVFKVEWSQHTHNHDHDHDHDHDHEHDHTDEGEDVTAKFEISVKGVQVRELPELSEQFILQHTDGAAETEEAFRDWIRERLQRSRDKQTAETLEQKVIDKVIEKHEFETPNSVVETYLDAFVKEFKDRYKESEIPEWFSEEEYRQSRRSQAESAARWMLIRDKVVEEHELKIEDAELDAKFEEMAEDFGDTFDGPGLRSLYERLNMVENIERQMLTDKAVEFFRNQLDVVDKTREDIERERAEAAAAAEKEKGKDDTSEEPAEPAGEADQD